jgi:hypothetical protein
MSSFHENFYSGRKERWEMTKDGYRWVAAEPVGEAHNVLFFNLWGYSENSSLVENLGNNIPHQEVESIAEKFLKAA